MQEKCVVLITVVTSGRETYENSIIRTFFFEGMKKFYYKNLEVKTTLIIS